MYTSNYRLPTHTHIDELSLRVAIDAKTQTHIYTGPKIIIIILFYEIFDKGGQKYNDEITREKDRGRTDRERTKIYIFFHLTMMGTNNNNKFKTFLIPRYTCMM